MFRNARVLSTFEFKKSTYEHYFLFILYNRGLT